MRLIGLGVIFAALFLWQAAQVSRAAETAQSTIYFPLVVRNFPPPPTIFGAESRTFTDPDLMQLSVDMRLSWLRIPAFDWSKIEPNAPVNGEHTYDWSQVPEDSLRNLAERYVHTIATIKMTPSWAQKYPGVYCGPVSQNRLGDFAAFVGQVVQRYSQPPYNIRYWELGNEPDVAPRWVSPDSVFGCWGDDDDDYYGGGYYADMLKVVYPAIKAADPQAQVLIGGLLLDCDPDDADCSDPKPPRFFEGILRNGGGDYFDIVSFHGYPYFSNGMIHDEDFVSWDQRGGVVLGKADFLRQVMAQYGINKPLFHTEGALLCPEWNTQDCNPPGAVYEDAKADYVVWLYTRVLASDFVGSIWYTLDGGGWRSGGLIGDPGDPNPAYYTYQFITQELEGAQYTGQPDAPDLRAYAFRTATQTVWVVWSPDGMPHDLTLPAGYTQVLDKFGLPIAVSGETISVESPVYVEIP